ncbi:MAG: hypothetical protein V1821_01185 [bacterium]
MNIQKQLELAYLDTGESYDRVVELALGQASEEQIQQAFQNFIQAYRQEMEIKFKKAELLGDGPTITRIQDQIVVSYRQRLLQISKELDRRFHAS